MYLYGWYKYYGKYICTYENCENLKSWRIRRCQWKWTQELENVQHSERGYFRITKRTIIRERTIPQRIKEKIGFSIGNFFSGDYKSGQNIWNEKSLCVSLTGTISDRGGTIATAVEIMAKHHLPMILVLNESGILEIANTGTVELKPHPQNRIKRIGE